MLIMTVKVYKGRVDMLGQKEFDQTSSTYAYVKLIDDNNEYVMLKNVLAYNTCDSFLLVGENVELYLTKFRDYYILLALVVNSRKIIDFSEVSCIDRASTSFMKVALLGMVFALPFSLLIIGIPMLTQCIFVLIKHYRIKKEYNLKRIQDSLSSYGFNVS
jgi:hypothetical protein